MWHLLARGCLAPRKHAEAEAGHYQTLRLGPDFVAAHNHLGVVLAQQGYFESAAASFPDALRLQPENAEAHANRGHALLRLGRCLAG